MPVDSIEAEGRFDRIVVGRIVGLERHPQADRLSICTVDAGPIGVFRVASGAPNLEAGLIVPLALPGAVLAGGAVIEAHDIRGVISEGAVVSEREIGISEDGSGVMRLPGPSAPGAALGDVLGTADTILDIDVTPNRGDCLSVLGIAREVAAVTGERIRDRRPRGIEKGAPASSRIRVEILDRDLCSRYVARTLTAVEVGDSPLWLRSRLESVGIRSINNVVDVTNYVMLERGQPLHAFDLGRLDGNRIEVRRARSDRKIRTLDEVERELETDDLVIADARGPVAIAGIMGGFESAVGPRSREILLESACFAPGSVRRTSKRLGLRSESSIRFERSVDVEGAGAAADRAAELLVRVAAARTEGGAIDVYPEPREPAEILVRSDRVNRLLGTAFAVPEIGQALRRVSANVKTAGRGGFRCRPPSYRSDLSREADFIEEVARLIGYDRIPETLPRVTLAEGVPLRTADARIRSLLVAAGMTEMICFRFIAASWNRRIAGLAADAPPVEVLNPLNADSGELRLSLVPGLLLAARRNRHQGEPWIRAFEIGTTFRRAPAGEIEEHRAVAGVLRGPIPQRGVLREEREESFLDAKGALESLLEGLGASPARWEAGRAPAYLHPGKSAIVRVDGEALGVVGGLHPALSGELELPGETWIFELDTKKLESYASRRVTFQPLPRVPAVVRDLAIVADEHFDSQTVLDAIAESSDLLVENVRLFDVYRGKPLPDGKKSLAYSIAYRARDRTLTDEEVNRLHEKLTETVTGLGVEVRR